MRLSRKRQRVLEISANVGILIVAALILGNFAWSKFRPKQDISGPIVGNSVALAGVNWKDNGSTLLMVLQKGCRYCEESAPFYRKLHDGRAGYTPRMLAVIPGEAVDTARYLSAQGVLTDGIINVSLREVNVSATPTLLLIDETGHIKNVWVGKLDDAREKEVLDKAIRLN